MSRYRNRSGEQNPLEDPSAQSLVSKQVKIKRRDSRSNFGRTSPGKSSLDNLGAPKPQNHRSPWTNAQFFGAALRGHTAGKECRGPWGLLSVNSRNLAFKGNNWMDWMLGFFPKCPPDTLFLGIEASLSLLNLGTLRTLLASRKPLPGPSEPPDGAALQGRTRVPTSKEGIDWTW